MVIIPGDLEGAYNGLLHAAEHGEITQRRINESVLKILRMKASVGLNRNRLVELANVEKVIARPESLAIAQKVADRAVTLVVDEKKLVPLAAAEPSAGLAGKTLGLVAVIFTDTPRGSDGSRAFVLDLRQRAPNATVFYVDATNAGFISNDVLAAVKGASRVIAVAESVPNPRRTTSGHAGGSVALDAGPAGLLNAIVKAAGVKTVVAAFGNPYTGDTVPGIQSYICTFSDQPVSAASLASALFGEIPIHGRLPVTLPGLGVRGAGLDRDAIPGR
jgi:beta-N-acetylhexosaminidase